MHGPVILIIVKEVFIVLVVAQFIFDSGVTRSYVILRPRLLPVFVIFLVVKIWGCVGCALSKDQPIVFLPQIFVTKD